MASSNTASLIQDADDEIVSVSTPAWKLQSTNVRILFSKRALFNAPCCVMQIGVNSFEESIRRRALIKALQ